MKPTLLAAMVVGMALGVIATTTAQGSGGASPPVVPSKTPPATAVSAFDRLVKQATASKDAGQLEAAADGYKKALAVQPGWIEGHWSLATLLYDLDRDAEAREHFRPVLTAEPGNALAWAMTGLCDARLHAYDQALAELRRARTLGLTESPVRWVALLQTALLVNRAGRFEEAFEMLREFAAKGEDSPSVIVAFGLSMLRLPYLPEEVPPEKREMVRLAGRGAFHLARGRRTAAGRLALEELVSRYPVEPNVRYAFGSYIAPEDPEAAIAEFSKELQRTPDHYPSLLQLAFLETRLGRAAEALPSAEKAVSLAPAVPEARLVLGRALLATGDGPRAVQELEKGAAMAPESADMQFALARAYRLVGRNDDAARARQEFLKLDRAARERQGKPGAEETTENEPS